MVAAVFAGIIGLVLSADGGLAQVTLGKQIDCNSSGVRQKLLPLLMDYAREQVRQVAAINGAAQPRVLGVDVVASALDYVGAPAIEGMLYEQCSVTGVMILQTADGRRTGRVAIPGLLVRVGYDRNGALHAQIPPDGQIY